LGQSRLQGDEDKKRNELFTQSEAEKELKEAVKAVIGSLHIKNFDKERMEREGLIHEDKIYELLRW